MAEQLKHPVQHISKSEKLQSLIDELCLYMFTKHVQAGYVNH